MTIIVFILILALLVFIHELGHFIAAKASGVRVDEFGLGFPPKLASVKKGETLYSLNLIPFGGFVKIFGEDPTEEDHIIKAENNFSAKPKRIQALILAAGIICNFLLAWVLISISLSLGVSLPTGYGTPSEAAYHTTIVGVVADSPAAQAGLAPGDEIESITVPPGTSLREYSTSVHIDNIQKVISDAGKSDAPVSLAYKRGSDEQTVTITPIPGPHEGYAVGIVMEETAVVKLPFYKAIVYAVPMTGRMIANIVIGLGQFFGNLVSGHADLSQVSGPVGIASLAGQAERIGFSFLLLFTAFISANLGVLNLIPFPALDGGRLLVVVLEKIKGKPISPSILSWVNGIGFILLIGLMIFVTIHDIFKLVR